MKGLLIFTILAALAVAAQSAAQIGYTIPRGNGWGFQTLRPAYHTAMCRCAKPDASEGMSICNSGCGDPNKICSTLFGCSNAQKACNNNKCTCKPEGISTNQMTYAECHAQCARLGMQPPASEAQQRVAQGTGCNIDGLEMWIIGTGDGVCTVSGDPHIRNFKGQKFDDYTFGDVIIYQLDDVKVIGHNGQSHSFGKRAVIQGVTVQVGDKSSSFINDKFCEVSHVDNGVAIEVNGNTGRISWGTGTDESVLTIKARCRKKATSATTFGNNSLGVKLTVPISKVAKSSGYCNVPDEEIGSKYQVLNEGGVFMAAGADLELFNETLERIKKEFPDAKEDWLGMAEDEIRAELSSCAVAGDPHILEFNGHRFSDYSKGWHLMYKSGDTKIIVENKDTPLYGTFSSVQGLYMTVGRASYDLAVDVNTCNVAHQGTLNFVKESETVFQYEEGKFKVKVNVNCEAGSHAQLAVYVTAPVPDAEISTGYCNASVKEPEHKYRHLTFEQLYAAADGDEELAMQEYQLCQTEPQEDVGSWMGCAEDRLKAKVKLEGICKNVDAASGSTLVRLQQAAADQTWRTAYRYVTDAMTLDGAFKAAAVTEAGWCWSHPRDGLIPLVEYYNPTWGDYYYVAGALRPAWLSALYTGNKNVCYIAKSAPYLPTTVLNQFYTADGSLNRLAALASIPVAGVKVMKMGYVWQQGCAAVAVAPNVRR